MNFDRGLLLVLEAIFELIQDENNIKKINQSA